MFGIKRSNIDFKNDEMEDNIPMTKDQEYIDNINKFIFYDDKNKFRSLTEIYIVPTNYKVKLTIVIDGDSTIVQIKEEIIKQLQLKSEFKNLNIIVEGLYKNDNNRKIYLPLEGKIKKYIKSGDIFYCNLITDEFWIKTYYNIRSLNFQKTIKIEYKLKRKMRYKKFKLILMKGGINFFIDNIINTKYSGFNYYLKLFEFKIKKHKMIITHNSHLKEKKKKTIDKILNYTSEIIVQLHFGIFEKLVFKNLKIPRTKNIKIRALEYSELNFEDLMNDKKFLPEYKAIKDISENFLNEQKNKNTSNFWFFSKRKPKKEKHKYSSSKKTFNLIDNNAIDELKEEDEDKDKEEKNIQMSVLKIDEINKKNNNDIISPKDNINIINNNNIIDNDNIITNLNIKEDEPKINSKKKKEKNDKIKRMIIITSQQILKEEKLKIRRKFNRQITVNFNRNNELKKYSPISKPLGSISSKYLKKYKNNDDILEKEKEKEKKEKIQNFEILEDDFFNINNDFKPKSFNEKKYLFNFGETKKNSRDNSDDLFIDEQNANDEWKNFKIPTTINPRRKSGINFFNNRLKEETNTEPIDENESSSNFDEDNKSETNTVKPHKSNKLGKFNIYDSKKKFFKLIRINKMDIAEDLKANFNDDQFINNIKNFRIFGDKNTMNKIRMPSYQQIEFLNEEHKFQIYKKSIKVDKELKFGNKFHVNFFLILLLVLLTMIILFFNIDFLSIYLDF